MLRHTALVLSFGCAFACACTPALAAEECYRADPGNSSITFQVSQAGAPFSGSFRRYVGEVCLSQGRVTRINATLEPASVDSGLPELDVALKDKEFFNVREHPRIAYVSTSTQSQGLSTNETQVVRGTLEIKGQRRETITNLRLQTTGQVQTLSGSMTLDRLQYGIGTGEWANTQWLGAQVRLDIKATLQNPSRAPASPVTPSASAPRPSK